ncbi:MAG: hypothetical protein AMXMBFR33_01620 [Candidatus Xenobia bacterium]
MSALPVSHELHGFRFFKSDPTRWDDRSKVPCECGKDAPLDPPCTITSALGTRVEQHARCQNPKCRRRWIVETKPILPLPNSDPKEELMSATMDVTLIQCATPGCTWPAAQDSDNCHLCQELAKLEAARPVDPLCPCECGGLVPPGRKYAARGCAGRHQAKQTRAEREKAHESKELTTPVNSESMPQTMESDACPQCGGPVGGTLLTYGPEVQEAAREALLKLRTPQPPDVYAVAAELARTHDSRTLRAAANLRDALAGSENH